MHRINQGKQIAKVSDGIYDISGETFITKIIVTGEISPKDYLYLRCLTNDFKLSEYQLIYRMADDYKHHSKQDTYIKYLDVLTKAFYESENTGGESMVCEGLFELFGTSSEEIRKQQEEKDLILINAANKRADDAYKRADEAEKISNKFRQKLISLGIDPDE